MEGPVDHSAASQRLALLSQAARALHGEPDLARVLAWTTSAAAAATGASASAICTLHRDGSPAWTVPGRESIHFSRIGDPRATHLFATVLADRVVLRLDAIDVSDRDAEATQRFLGIVSMLVVPIPAAGTGTHGAIFLGHPDAHRFDDEAEAAAVALAAHLGVAMDNHATLAHLAALEAMQAEVVHHLQEAVRPPTPPVQATELGVFYRAAEESAPTGGDLYDWVLLPSGELQFTVVDVMGKGVAATKDAVAVTHALRLLAFDGCPLDELVARADPLVCAQNHELVATLIVGRYDPATGTVRLAGAGHPPAIVVHDGVAREIAAPGIPIGWPGAGSHGTVEVQLDRSDVLVLYTDGLIEATKDILAGLEALADAAVATSSYPAAGMARALVDRALEGAARHDDSLALVLRRRTPPVAGTARLLPPFEHRLTPNLANVGIARHLLADWLGALEVDADERDDVLLVVAELLSNAVRHASGAPGSVVIRARAEGDSVVLEVEDDGGKLQWPSRPSDELPDPEAEQGRGLFLVRALSDEVTTRSEDGRTVIEVVKRAVLPAAASEAMPSHPPVAEAVARVQPTTR